MGCCGRSLAHSVSACKSKGTTVLSKYARSGMFCSAIDYKRSKLELRQQAFLVTNEKTTRTPRSSKKEIQTLKVLKKGIFQNLIRRF